MLRHNVYYHGMRPKDHPSCGSGIKVVHVDRLSAGLVVALC